MNNNFDQEGIIDYLEQYSGEIYTTVLLHLLSEGDSSSIRDYTDSPDYRNSFNDIAYDADSTLLTYDITNAMCYGQALLHGVSKQDALLILIDNISKRCADPSLIAGEVSRIFQAYADAVRHTEIGTGLSPLLGKAAHYISDNLSAAISLQELAAYCGCSKSKLQQAFRQELGMSPKTYIRKKKIQKACHWLKDDHMTSLHVSLKLGYCSQSYFIREFKRETGMTPGKFCETEKS